MKNEKSSTTFEPGQVAQLKSGGPAVTVLKHDGDMVDCLFYSDELGEFKETQLPAIALELLDVEEEDEEEDEEDE